MQKPVGSVSPITLLTVSVSSKRTWYLCCGARTARSKGERIDASKHLLLTSAHPSPLSAYRGFLGNGHFSQCNKFLLRTGQIPINWRLPELTTSEQADLSL